MCSSQWTVCVYGYSRDVSIPERPSSRRKVGYIKWNMPWRPLVMLEHVWASWPLTVSSWPENVQPPTNYWTIPSSVQRKSINLMSKLVKGCDNQTDVKYFLEFISRNFSEFIPLELFCWVSLTYKQLSLSGIWLALSPDWLPMPTSLSIITVSVPRGKLHRVRCSSKNQECHFLSL